MSDYLTPAQFAADSGVNLSENAVRMKLNAGEIQHVRIAGRVLIPSTEVTRFLASWPSKNRGVSNRWKAYRQWKAAMLAGEAAA